MLRLVPERAPLKLLCLGAHSDDIEIGAGGTVLTLLAAASGSRVRWVVFSATARTRRRGAGERARVLLAGAAQAQWTFTICATASFRRQFATLKDMFETLKDEEKPDLILTHAREDHHQDHRLVAELTANTFRDHVVLGYEIPKYDPDLGNPGLFVPLGGEVAERKVAALMAHFATQRQRRWFVPETFFGADAAARVAGGGAARGWRRDSMRRSCGCEARLPDRRPRQILVRHQRHRQRPDDAERRIVIAHAAGEIRRMRRGHLVQHLAVFDEREEARARSLAGM